MDNQNFYDSAVESELQKNGVYASVTKGVSMSPLFKTNRDMIILKKIDEEPKRLDVVLYRSGSGKYLLHRIVKVLPDHYVIRGDNTYTPENVGKNEIIAILTEFNRKGKRRSVDHVGYRVYSSVWTFIYPLRYLFRKLRGIAGRVYRRMFKKKSN